MQPVDTIAAIATAPGQGSVGIVRLSGPSAEDILCTVFTPASAKALPLQSHLLTYGHVSQGEKTVDECMAVLMRAPRSYTKEDVAEIHTHGGTYVSQQVLSLCLAAGARLAEPGEFTRRAFLNGRIDLSQAEAVMGLIAAQGAQAHAAAIRQLEGGASSFITTIAKELDAIAAGVAACVDYSDEISEEEATADLLPRLQATTQQLHAAMDERAARMIHQGLQVVLCGKPNVGKSSLLNALLGEEKAIVTNIPGTTRDMVEGTMVLQGALIHLIDTAGLRETADLVEQIGVARSSKAMENADLILAVLDCSTPLTDEDIHWLQGLPIEKTALVLNKSDLNAVVTEAQLQSLVSDLPVMSVSAQQPDSLVPLKALIAQKAGEADQLVLTQPRHLDAARRAEEALLRAITTLQLGYPVDLVTVDLDAARHALGEITGHQVDETLLDAVFSQFCVGK